MEAKFIEITSSARSFFAKLNPVSTGTVSEANDAVGDDDGHLIARLKAGEVEVIGLIYDRYAPSLYRMLCALLGESDAQDALQELFVQIATRPPHRVRDLRAYLFGAARHEAFDILRRRKRECQWSDDEMEFAVSVTDGSTANDLRDLDWTGLLSRLPVEQREVIALKVWEEMTFVEIARIVKASPNTVMSRYRYGIQRLRDWCREEDPDA